jgi:hypothetical protein
MRAFSGTVENTPPIDPIGDICNQHIAKEQEI